MDIQRPDLLKRKKLWQVISITLCSLLFISLASAMLLYEQGPFVVEQEYVFTAKVEYGDLVQKVRGTGELVPAKMLWVSAQAAGKVERIHVLPGTQVFADTVIMELSNPDLLQQFQNATLQLASDKAAFASRKVSLESDLLRLKGVLAKYTADHKKATLHAEINQQLFLEGLESDLNVKQSKLTVEQLAVQLALEKQRYQFQEESIAALLSIEQARIDQSKARYDLLASHIEALKVKAGFDGILQRQTIKEGQRVGQGSSLAQVINPQSLKAQLRISEHQAKDIVIGLKAKIDTHNGLINGQVIRIDPNVEQGTVVVDIELTGELPIGVRPNLTVEGTIQIANRPNTLFVKKPSFAQEHNKVKIFKLNDKGIANKVHVSYGHSSVYYIEVLSGLKVGDEIIVSDTSDWDKYDQIQLK